MERSAAVYRNFQLVAIEQPSGRYRVEISPKAGGGEPVLTSEFRATCNIALCVNDPDVLCVDVSTASAPS